MQKLKTIFIGTPDFAVPSLKAILADDYFNLATVVTQPDMPVGRRMLLTAPPVKVIAQAHHLPILQPQKIEQIFDQLRDLQPDIIIVAAYAKLIPENIFTLPKYGCINLHGSFLPKYRGAAVIQQAILNNDREAGVAVMLMDEHLDTGPILAQAGLLINADDTAATLYDRLAELGAKILTATIKKYISGEIKPQAQIDADSVYCHRLTKQDGLIDWQQPAAQVERFVRAMIPWPTAWTWLNGKQLKILEVQAEPIGLNAQKSGKTFIYNRGLAIQCGTDALIVKRLQLEGKNQMTSEEFLRGQSALVGSILG